MNDEPNIRLDLIDSIKDNSNKYSKEGLESSSVTGLTILKAHKSILLKTNKKTIHRIVTFVPTAFSLDSFARTQKIMTRFFYGQTRFHLVDKDKQDNFTAANTGFASGGVTCVLRLGFFSG